MNEWLEFSIPGRRFKVPFQGLSEDLVERLLFWFDQVAHQSFITGLDHAKAYACNCACKVEES